MAAHHPPVRKGEDKNLGGKERGKSRVDKEVSGIWRRGKKDHGREEEGDVKETEGCREGNEGEEGTAEGDITTGCKSINPYPL